MQILGTHFWLFEIRQIARKNFTGCQKCLFCVSCKPTVARSIVYGLIKGGSKHRKLNWEFLKWSKSVCVCEACLFPLGSCADRRSSNSERKPMAFISVVKSGSYTVRSGTYKGKLLMNYYFFQQVPPTLDFLVTWLALSDSFWNPFLYWLLNSHFRRISNELLQYYVSSIFR